MDSTVLRDYDHCLNLLLDSNPAMQHLIQPAIDVAAQQ